MTHPANRLFLAATPDRRAREALLAMQGALRRGLPAGVEPRWIGPEDLHLTLRFFGAADAPQQQGIEALAAEAASRYPPRTLAFIGLDAWPRERPRVLVAEFAADPVLSALAAELEAGARGLGFKPETRPFRAHLTLARMHSHGPLPALPNPALTAAYPVAALTLFDRGSRTGAPRYAEVRSWPLAGA